MFRSSVSHLKVTICLSLVATCCACSGLSFSQGEPGLEKDVLLTESELVGKAQALVRQFVGELKPTLKAALESQGPAAAIAVCAERAPAIAAKLSEESSWQIKRVSLKPRNPSAEPDRWQAEQLRVFDIEAAKRPNQSLKLSSWRPGYFRYLQAQRVEPLCLACHGEVIAQSISEQLAQYYPADAATGYQLGQVRGAIAVDYLW
ncbi:Tll0287-like domain-containing protein [Aurantivibrio plasticivorans]